MTGRRRQSAAARAARRANPVVPARGAAIVARGGHGAAGAGCGELRVEPVSAASLLHIIREIEASPVWDGIEDSYAEEETPPAP